MEATKEKIDKYINGANVTRILQVNIGVKRKTERLASNIEKEISIQSNTIVNIARYILPDKCIDSVQLMNIVQ